MDGTDDSMFSPLIMLVKFPSLRRLSAKYRRFNTRLEADTKVLQEMLRQGTLQPGTFELESIEIYHPYMTHEPQLEVFQKTLQRLSRHSWVDVDIRKCGDLPEEDSVDVDGTVALQRLLISSPDTAAPAANLQNQDHQGNSDISISSAPVCQRIISTTARCWACRTPFKQCWMCVPICSGCHSRRLPPLVNIQRARRHQMSHTPHQKTTAVRQEVDLMEEEFSVFE
ncbi:hypothetical protein BDF14DRAFT_1726473 [Spinellus fusiger]|nr:hypothetical protein BDF14DRAFT_1726473 [Spinellus fusiger]